MLEVSA